MRQYAGFGSAEETNARFRYLLERGQTGLSVAFDLPTQLGSTPTTRAAPARSAGTGVAIDSLDDMERAVRRYPARRGVDLDDDQRARIAAAAPVRAGRRGAGRARASSCAAPSRTTSSRSTSPAATTSSRRGRPCASPTDMFAYCPERLPRWNTISISGYHIREAGSTAVQELAFTLANGIAYCEAAVAAGPVAGRVRRAALVLLQRPQPLLPGGGEVPGGPPALGRDHARPLRRDESAGAGAALPRADRRLDADRAAAREQHRAGRDPGALGGRAAAPSRCTRTASTRRSRCRPSTRRRSRCARSRSSRTRRAHRHGRPARRLLLRRGAHGRAGASGRASCIAQVDELGGAVAAIEQGLVQAEIEDAAFAYQQRVESASGSSSASTASPTRATSRAVELHRLDPEAERRQLERTRAGAGRARPGGRGSGARRGPGSRTAATATCCRRCGRPRRALHRSARSATPCARSSGPTPHARRRPRVSAE